MNQKIRAVIILLIIISIGTGIIVAGFTLIPKPQNNSSKSDSDQLIVVTTLFPLADIASQVGGDKVKVTLLGEGQDAHDYEPTPQEISEVNQADLFIYNGGGIDDWADEVIKNSQVRQNRVLKMIDYVDRILNIDELEGSSNIDPHIWLNPLNVLNITTLIEDSLSIVDKTNQNYYQKRHDSFANSLVTLTQDYERTLDTCKTKTVFVEHNAFGYLGDAFGLRFVSLKNMDDDENVTPQTYLEFLNQVKESSPQVIFAESNEELSSDPNSFGSIARELNIQVDSLNPIEVGTLENIKNNEGYLTLMKRNLDTLSQALSCS